MSRKTISLLIIGLCISLALSGVSYAFVLLTKKQAFKKVFGKGREIVTETKRLKGESLARIKKRLGGKLVHFQKGSESKRVKGKTKIEFHFALKDGQKTGVAIIDVEPGKWGPVKFIIAMDLKGAVRKVRVMSYQEKRGRPIARLSFLRQYRGKTSKSRLKVGKDITGVSGATISSISATFAVKKAILLYKEFYLK
jgi:Na+-translocating ferredoxin:NAD+ oxidoreductase RnfG subunit